MEQRDECDACDGFLEGVLMARPQKLTPELTQQISLLIREGNLPSVSASICGISPSTFFNWMKRGREGEPRFLEFSESVERAFAGATIDRVSYIARAAEIGHWRAAAWLLERTCPERYGKRSAGMAEWDARQEREFSENSRVSIEDLEDKVHRIQVMRGKAS